jgi:hypothetical protein
MMWQLAGGQFQEGDGEGFLGSRLLNTLLPVVATKTALWGWVLLSVCISLRHMGKSRTRERL